MPDEGLSRYVMTEEEAEAIRREGITLESVIKEIEIKYGLMGVTDPSAVNDIGLDPERDHSH